MLINQPLSTQLYISSLKLKNKLKQKEQDFLNELLDSKYKHLELKGNSLIWNGTPIECKLFVSEINRLISDMTQQFNKDVLLLSGTFIIRNLNDNSEDCEITIDKILNIAYKRYETI